MNYIGSKLSLIDFLEDNILSTINKKNNRELVFADLFSGTGVVASTFKKKNFKVIANDIQYYSYVINKYLIESKEEIDKELVEYLDNLAGVEGFIYKNYCMGSGCQRNYFTDFNGKKCDAIRQEIEFLYKNNNITEDQYYRLLASLLEVIDKHANTTSVYGAFLKHIKKSALKNFKFEILPLIKGNQNGKVYNNDINILVKNIRGDILYLDPPYNGRQYASNYHILETIARYDNPVITGKTGLRDYRAQKSDYCSKLKVTKKFEDLIKTSNFNHIFLSYNNEGLMSIQNIRNIMSKYGEYKVFKKENYKRFKADRDNKRNHKANTTVEYLHYLYKKEV